MTFTTVARADARALTSGLLAGAAVGIALGGAYFVGAAARTSDDHSRAERLADAASRRFSEGALRAETLTMGPAAVTNPHPTSPVAVAGVTTRISAPALRPTVTRVSLPQAPAPAHGALQSSRDLDCLTDAVYYEARGETGAGQAAVAQVVLNRVRHPGFPKSVCGVVFQGVRNDGCQFSFVCDGSMHRPKEAEAWRRAEQVAARALTGFVMPSVGAATHFHAVGADPGWGPGLMKVAQVGLHVFYRFGGYSSASAHFDDQPERQVADNATSPPPVAPSASADGRPAGQYILASATVAAPAPPQPALAKPAPLAVDPPAPAKPDAAKPKPDTGA